MGAAVPRWFDSCRYPTRFPFERMGIRTDSRRLAAWAKSFNPIWRQSGSSAALRVMIGSLRSSNPSAAPSASTVRPVNGNHMFRQSLERDLSLKCTVCLLVQQEPNHFHWEER